MEKIGVIHGRFQPFHNDHLKFILEGLKRVDLLYIGITNPDPSLTLDDKTDVKRSQIFANPCTYYERLQMVKKSLSDLNINSDKYLIVPFPINFPELWKYYTPLNAIFFLTIYDAWGDRKQQLLTDNGLNVDVLWRKSESEKGIAATSIRNNIVHSREWIHLVPKATIDVIKENNIEKRIIEIYKSINNYI